MSISTQTIIKHAYKLTQGSPEYDANHVLPNNISQEDKGKIGYFSHLLLLIQSQEHLPSSDDFIQSLNLPAQQAGSRRRTRRRKSRR